MSDPRWLTREDAARYLSLSQAAFTRRVKDGILPQGVGTLGHLRWDRAALDAAMTGAALPRSPEDVADAIAAEIRAKAQGRPQAPSRRHYQGIPIRARAG